MKKEIRFALGLVCLLMMTACGRGEDGKTVTDGGQGADAQESGQPADASASGEGEEMVTGADAGQEGPEETDGEADAQTYKIRLRIVDGAESGSLVLAGEGSGQVYTLTLHSASLAEKAEGDGSRPATAVFLDGQPADFTALEDGMMVEVSFDGTIEETFPAQFGGVESVSAYSLGTEQNPGGGLYDLCGLYLQVLNDLWDKDEGLNGNISWVSVDLSQAPGGLTKGEQDAVAWIFGCERHVDSLTLTFEELQEQGYLTEAEAGSGLWQWEDGVLFSITSSLGEEVYSLPVVRFDAKKWRSPRGAYFLMDCTAVWPEMGTWSSYEIGGEGIS